MRNSCKVAPDSGKPFLTLWQTLVGHRSRSPDPARIRWQRWALVAACLVALFAAWSWRTTSHEGFAYGIEDVPQRLAEVQSFRLRGWQWIPWDNGKKKQPPLRVPMEITVQRPGKFRYTGTGISFHQGQKPTIRQSVILCDGKHQWILDGDNKLRFARSCEPFRCPAENGS